jgi:hypothetical protein
MLMEIHFQLVMFLGLVHLSTPINGAICNLETIYTKHYITQGGGACMQKYWLMTFL